jgi:hypothetical protein
MEIVVTKVLSIVFIAIVLVAAFALAIVVGRISNFLIRKLLGIGGN